MTSAQPVPCMPTVLHLRRGGTSVIARVDGRTLPCILHWGPDLGELSARDLASLATALTPPYVDSVVSSQATVALLPQHSSGWLGRPGLLGSRSGGRSWSVSFESVEHHLEGGRSVDLGRRP